MMNLERRIKDIDRKIPFYDLAVERYATEKNMAKDFETVNSNFRYERGGSA